MIIPKKLNFVFIGFSVAVIITLLGIGIWNKHVKKLNTIGMVYIPAGWFWMGCAPNDFACNGTEPEEERPDEKPYHKVYLDAYYIDKNDVTVSEYKKCVEAGGCTEPRWNNCYIINSIGQYLGTVGSEFQKDNKPVVCVDWNQANAYCQWAGKRLPTEAQWEKAARGTDGRIYPWGNVWDETRACFGQASTCAIGSYPQGASPYGVMDMAGNVSDWCSDWYDYNYYNHSQDHNPLGPNSGYWHVLRGGGWFSLYDSVEDPDYLRSSSRGKGEPEEQDFSVGFRCVGQVSK